MEVNRNFSCVGATFNQLDKTFDKTLDIGEFACFVARQNNLDGTFLGHELKCRVKIFRYIYPES